MEHTCYSCTTLVILDAVQCDDVAVNVSRQSWYVHTYVYKHKMITSHPEAEVRLQDRYDVVRQLK